MGDPQRPDYGLDAPPVLYGFTGCGVAGVVLLVLGAALSVGVLVSVGIALAVIGLGTGAAMFYSSKAGKVRVRDRMLRRLALRGDEDVLDLGCGSGLMLVGAAGQLDTGTATGIDLWRRQDQAGSSPDKCLENARRAGVAGKVRVRDGDMAELPFPDASFDVVLASLSVHNLHPAARRERAVSEAARVLRPGGRLAWVDIAGTKAYVRAAEQAGLRDVSRSFLVFGIWPPARVVTAKRLT
jgi:arsenite methyltransferase